MKNFSTWKLVCFDSNGGLGTPHSDQSECQREPYFGDLEPTPPALVCSVFEETRGRYFLMIGVGGEIL